MRFCRLEWKNDQIMKHANQLAVFEVLFISFLIWFLTCILYLHYFDRYEVTTDDVENHAMIKSDPGKYWAETSNVVRQIQTGVNPMVTGNPDVAHILYKKCLAIYGLIGHMKFFEKDGRVTVGGKFWFLLFQALLYYISLYFFYYSISKVMSSRIALISTGFLAIEPTILQFHTSFWTESLFISLEVFAIALFINPSRKIILKFTSVGILIGLMYLQRPVAILYVVVLLIVLIIRFYKNSVMPSIALSLGYLIIIGLVGSYSYYRSDAFYIMPKQASDVSFHYLANHVVAAIDKISPQEARIRLVSRSKEVANRRNVHLSYIQRDMALDIFKNYPFITIKRIFISMLRSLGVDPLMIYKFYLLEYKPTSASVLAEQSGQKMNLFRPIIYFYTVLLLGITAFGFVLSWKRLKAWINLLFLLSILYFWILGGWFGNPRFMVPVLVFYSVYFAVATDWFFERVKYKTANIRCE